MRVRGAIIMKEIIEIPIDKEDEKLIAQAEEILTDLGLDRSTALTVFLPASCVT